MRALPVFFLTSLFLTTAAAQTPLALLDDLVTANHILANEGVLDGYGHVSARNPANPNHFFLARAVAPGLATVADIVEYDLDSKPVVVKADARAPGGDYLERFIHSEIYRARPDVMAVVHSHSAELIPFADTGVPLQPVHHMGYFIGQGVPVFEIRKVAGSSDMLVGTPALGKALADVLGPRRQGDLPRCRRIKEGHPDLRALLGLLEIPPATLER